MSKSTTCDHDWERNDPACIYSRKCSKCGALGYVRHRRTLAYVCRFPGCKRNATESLWSRMREVRTCAEHRSEFAS